MLGERCRCADLGSLWGCGAMRLASGHYAKCMLMAPARKHVVPGTPIFLPAGVLMWQLFSSRRPWLFTAEGLPVPNKDFLSATRDSLAMQKLPQFFDLVLRCVWRPSLPPFSLSFLWRSGGQRGGGEGGNGQEACGQCEETPPALHGPSQHPVQLLCAHVRIVVCRCVESNPKDRPSATEVKEALQDMIVLAVGPAV